jgi:tRNA nucleotidyltransferase (CCA-adding enzyme)
VPGARGPRVDDGFWGLLGRVQVPFSDGRSVAGLTMKMWLVGGAVRDTLMGFPVDDRDWVVVGATPQDLLSRGYLPVGQDFPVFLHPITHEQVALARTERKTGPGYHGFSFHAAPGVTLEEDLLRRDLTINAMAQDENGTVVDPYGGRRDLADKVLRHVSPAFSEDPVRILRLARFAARMPDFTIAPETRQLMQAMVQAGEVDALVSERVWQELARGLMTPQPSRMFEALRDCGALGRLLPEVEVLWGVCQGPVLHSETVMGEHLMRVLDQSAELQAPLAVRFACLAACQNRGVEWVRSLSERLRVPTECRELAEVVVCQHERIHAAAALGAGGLVTLLTQCDAFRRPQRFSEILWVCECDFRARPGFKAAPYPPRTFLWEALCLAREVNTADIAKKAAMAGLKGGQVGQKIQSERAERLRCILHLKP